MKERSLGRRAVALVLITEIVCAVVFSLTSLWHERHVRQRALDVTLQGRADSLLGAIRDTEDPQDNVSVDPEELRLPSEDIWLVYNQGGHLIGRSPNAPPELVGAAQNGFGDVSLAKRPYRVLVRPGLRIIDHNENSGQGIRRPVTIVYAAPMRHIVHEIGEAATFYMALSALLILLTALILILTLRRLLRPLDELAATAAGVAVHSDTFTPPQSALQIRELRPLAEALSASIGRLRHALEVEHRFISDAAHELKTAVAVVRSSVQLLTLRERSSSEYVQGLDRVLDDNQRVEQLVARMLTLGRFEEQTQSERGMTDLTESAARTIRNLEPWISSRQVSTAEFATCCANVPLTAEAADTLVSNLVMNAVQHSPAGSQVKLHIAKSTPETQVIFAVEDKGTGIPAESLPHVFERFYREDTSRSRQTGGAGLGLAICKSIVQGAGGTIQIHSAPGQGTTVTVRLRLLPPPDGSASSGSTPQA